MAGDPTQISADFLFKLREEVGSRTVLAEGAPGSRTIAHLVGGDFEGPRLHGKVEGPAGDWITHRGDGAYRLDVRLTLRTHDGAAILLTYLGIATVTPDGAMLRMAGHFDTGDERYRWLNGLQAVGVGQRIGPAVSYDVYALR